MNLIKFLIIGTIFSTVFGEFARFPFGSSSGAISTSDILLLLANIFFVVWHVSTKRKIYYPKAFKYLSLFWITGFLSLIYSLTSFSVPEVIKGGMYLVRFIIYSSALLLVFNLIKTKVLQKESLINILNIVGIALAFLGFIQLLVLPNFDTSFLPLTNFGFDPHQGRLASTFLDPNFVGAYLVLTLGLVLFKLKQGARSILIFQVLILVAAISLTFSRSAYLMLLIFLFTIGLLFWNKISNKQKIMSVLVVVVFITSLSFISPRFYERVVGGLKIDQSASERFKSWQDGLLVFRQNPIIGVGFNNTRVSLEKLNLFKPFSADGGHSGGGVDSSLLFVLVTTGLVGLLFYLLFWFTITRTIYYQKKDFNWIILSLIIGLFFNAQFINSLFFPPIMLWYFTVLGTILE